MKYFATSDIHGYYDELIRALKEKGFNFNDDTLIVCGDAFDRGGQAVEVYKLLKDLADKGHLVYIRGNHEDLLMQCLEDREQLGRWVGEHHYANGTVYTVHQFENAGILDEVVKFINYSTVNYFEVDNNIFVHGWVPYVLKDLHDPSGELSCVMEPEILLDADTYMWDTARWDNGMKQWHQGIVIQGKTIVCGHWHTSFGHYHYHNVGSGEFCSDSDFSPFVDKGIVALDACTAHTRKVNVMEF